MPAVRSPSSWTPPTEPGAVHVVAAARVPRSALRRGALWLSGMNARSAAGMPDR